MNRLTKLSPVIFIACALCFLLPFITISAGGNQVGSFSGFHVATGITVNAPQAQGTEDTPADKLDADPMAVFALLCILLSFVMSFVATGGLAIFPAIGGLIGAGALFAMKFSVAAQVAKQTSGRLQVSYLPGYFVALACMGLAAVWNVYLYLGQKHPVEEEDLVPRSAFGEGPVTFHETAEPVRRAIEPPPLTPLAAIPELVPLNDAVICSQCGTTLKADTRYCTVCGHTVGAPATVVQPEPLPPPVAPAPEISLPEPVPVSSAPELPAPTPVAEPQSSPIPQEAPVSCFYCGAALPPNVRFCTACGKPVRSSTSVLAPEPVAPLTVSAPEAVREEPIIAAPAATLPENDAISCTECGATLPAGSRFCNICGKPVAASAPLPTPVSIAPVAPVPLPEPPIPSVAPQVIAFPQSTPSEDYSIIRDNPRQEPAVLPDPAPLNPPITVIPPRAARRAKKPFPYNAVAIAVVALFLVGGAISWYFWGVDTVIVCAPYDAKVFLDGAELPPDSPGRFSVDHLARGPHMLKAQREGYSEAFLNLDFPITTVSEWINVRLSPVSDGKKSSEGRVQRPGQPPSHVR